jgi:hypothetical protein
MKPSAVPPTEMLSPLKGFEGSDQVLLPHSMAHPPSTGVRLAPQLPPWVLLEKCELCSASERVSGALGARAAQPVKTSTATKGHTNPGILGREV